MKIYELCSCPPPTPVNYNANFVGEWRGVQTLHDVNELGNYATTVTDVSFTITATSDPNFFNIYAPAQGLYRVATVGLQTDNVGRKNGYFLLVNGPITTYVNRNSTLNSHITPVQWDINGNPTVLRAISTGTSFDTPTNGDRYFVGEAVYTRVN